MNRGVKEGGELGSEGWAIKVEVMVEVDDVGAIVIGGNR